MRAHLVALVLISVLPAGCVGAAALAWSYQQTRVASIDSARSEARALRQAVDGVLNSSIAGLQVLVASPTLDAMPAMDASALDTFRAHATRALALQGADSMALSDTEGRQLVNTRRPLGTPLPPHGLRPLQRRVIESGRPIVSDVFMDSALQRRLVAIEVPVRHGDKVQATLGMGLALERFAALIEERQPPWPRTVVILDRAGTVIARSQEDERHMARSEPGRKAAHGLIDAIARAPEGILNTETLDGVPVLTAYSRSANGWTITVGVPRAALLPSLHLWTAGAAAVLVGVLAAWLLTRRIAAAVGALVEPATALGAGRPVTLRIPPIKEAAAVARAIERASKLLLLRTGERDAATYAAQHDSLTGLANRHALLKRTTEALQACSAAGSPLAVLFIDIDDFKPVNDDNGHAVGDAVLRDFGARLRAGVRAHDLVARLGGDEFAVLIEGHSAREAKSIAAGLVDRLSRPYAIGPRTVCVSACVGIAGYPEDGVTAAELMTAADAAMYRAKAAGKRGFAMSGPAPLQ